MITEGTGSGRKWSDWKIEDGVRGGLQIMQLKFPHCLIELFIRLISIL